MDRSRVGLRQPEGAYTTLEVIMTDNTFESTCTHLDTIACIYLVYADGCVMERTTELAEALRSLRSWASQLNAALPNMGDRCSIEIILGEN